MGHDFNCEAGRIRLMIDAESSLCVPISSVARVLDENREVFLNLTVTEASADPWDPAGTPGWRPLDGWADQEEWDNWEGDGKWVYYLTDSDVAYALVPRPTGGAEFLEMRLLPISYAMRILGSTPAPNLQFVRLSLDVRLLGDIPLSDTGWQTIQLALPETTSDPLEARAVLHGPTGRFFSRYELRRQKARGSRRLHSPRLWRAALNLLHQGLLMLM
jgi:hypothetical protein